MTTNRLSILKASLEKKQQRFDGMLSEHMEDVRGAQGEPMRGHRGGEKVLRRWDKQNSALRTLDASIDKTKAAIEREEFKIAGCEAAKEDLPGLFLKLMEEGVLRQWRKYPNMFFVAGVAKARIVWDAEKKVAAHRYYGEVKDEVQRKVFRDVYNRIYNELKG